MILADKIINLRKRTVGHRRSLQKNSGDASRFQKNTKCAVYPDLDKIAKLSEIFG